MRKSLIVLMIIILMMSLLLIGCAENADREQEEIEFRELKGFTF